MKIIQTLWLYENDTSVLNNKCGWLSAEYNWISWSLSVFQLRKFYSEVELFTNKAGKEVLIDLLNLPYSKVHEFADDINVPAYAWALAKIHTYQMQNKPFIHVDGDVYIYAPLSEDLLTSPLVAQSIEIGFENYQQVLNKVKEKFQYIPLILSKSLPSQDMVYNAGILGGSDTNFFKEYAQIAIDFVKKNQHIYPQLNESSSSYCMLFEQYLFSIMVKESGLEVDTLFKEPFHNQLYPGLSDFLLQTEQKYVHFMGITKTNRFKLKQLINEFRQNYPHFYYKILRLCQQAGISLDFKIYSLPELDPSTHSVDYFLEVLTAYSPANKISQEINWSEVYAKDAYIFNQLKEYLNLEPSLLYQRLISLNQEAVLKEVPEHEFKVYILIPDTRSLEVIQLELNDLKIIILTTLEEGPKCFDTIMEEIKIYFDSTDYYQNYHILRKMVLEKIRELIYEGAIRIEK
jgi:DNA-binding HxlR family transcriptional regulator